MNFYSVFIELCSKNNVKPSDVSKKLGITKSSISNWKTRNSKPNDITVVKLADYFGVTVDYLLNGEKKEPNIAEDYARFPVIGEVAAGYDHIAAEDWTGDTVDVPLSWLHGRKQSEFFVLRVTGDSMYPTYQDGDKVLVLKQETLNHSGQVGVILYGGDTGTLKKVEYADGEDWLRLVPINPAYPPKKITGTELNECRVIGIPKMLIREIED